jgi:hypothetical protein
MKNFILFISIFSVLAFLALVPGDLVHKIKVHNATIKNWDKYNIRLCKALDAMENQSWKLKVLTVRTSKANKDLPLILITICDKATANQLSKLPLSYYYKFVKPDTFVIRSPHPYWDVDKSIKHMYYVQKGDCIVKDSTSSMFQVFDSKGKFRCSYLYQDRYRYHSSRKDRVGTFYENE